MLSLRLLKWRLSCPKDGDMIFVKSRRIKCYKSGRTFMLRPVSREGERDQTNAVIQLGFKCTMWALGNSLCEATVGLLLKLTFQIDLSMEGNLQKYLLELAK